MGILEGEEPSIRFTEVIEIERLKLEIKDWKKWLIEDLHEIMTEEIAKDVEVLSDCLLEKRLIKEKWPALAVVSKRRVDDGN